MKAQEVKQLAAEGNYQAALRGAKDFHIGVTKDQRSVMCRAYEAIVHPRFYKQIGIDTEKAIQEGIKVLRTII